MENSGIRILVFTTTVLTERDLNSMPRTTTSKSPGSAGSAETEMITRALAARAGPLIDRIVEEVSATTDEVCERQREANQQAALATSAATDASRVRPAGVVVPYED